VSNLIHPVREAWLNAAVDKLRPLFSGSGYEIPEIRVSVGWPSRGGLAVKKRVIGQCWFGMTAKDGKPQLFISPLLDSVLDPQGVLATLVHEIGHVAAGPEAKHGPKFVKVMKAVGLAGKPTATHADEELLKRLESLATDLGPFPHSRLEPIAPPKVQSTRMIKMTCGCGYLARTTQKWLDAHGAVICPCNKQPMTVEEKFNEPNDE
jgi:hypothetical protein